MLLVLIIILIIIFVIITINLLFVAVYRVILMERFELVSKPFTVAYKLSYINIKLFNVLLYKYKFSNKLQ